MGTAYWGGMLDWLRNAMLAGGYISEPDLALLSVTDSPDEAIAIIERYTAEVGVGPNF